MVNISITNSNLTTYNFTEKVYAGLSYNIPLNISLNLSDQSLNNQTLTIEQVTDNVANLPTNLTISETNSQFNIIFNPLYNQIGHSYTTSFTVTNATLSINATITIVFTIHKATVDELINIVNNAICKIQVECDKLNTIEEIICIKEKHINIYNNANLKALKNKKNNDINKKLDN